jgi:glycosyltransferase involved in cell wall biosynthesis
MTVPRVVFVDHVARLSGGEIALLRLLPALSSHVDVRVILGEEGPLVGHLRDLGVETEVMPLPERVREVRKEAVRLDRLDPIALAYLPNYVHRLSRRLRALDADLVHTNSLKSALYGGVAGRLAGVPVVWHVRDRIASDYLPGGAVWLVRAASRVLPAAVVANSKATLATLPASTNGQVIHSAVVQDSVRRQAGTGPLPRREVEVVGIVGRLAPWKGQHVFLEAFAKAFRGTNVRGYVIGSVMFGEDSYGESLRRQAAQLGISDQVEFRGFREDVEAELSELDVLVHCSVTPEPFGQAVLEGMAAGLPVIASGAGGPAELITNGVDGILTTPSNIDELAAALRQLCDDPQLRARLGEAARQRSLDFTPERTASQLLEVYRKVLAQNY